MNAMVIEITIHCKDCGNKTIAKVEPDDAGKIYLSDSIENKHEGFYCGLNWQYAMQINCNCGNGVKLHY